MIGSREASAMARSLVACLCFFFFFTSLVAAESVPHHSLQNSTSSSHVWPELRFNWRSALAFFTVFLGAALGSASGLGGGSIFVPTANLILGFDPKSSTALSNCMITAQSISCVVFNLRMKHPLHESMPLIDYDIALLLQPMLLLGISIGVTFSLMVPSWMITLLLFVILIGTGLRTAQKAVVAWKQETIQNKMLYEEQNIHKDEFKGNEDWSHSGKIPDGNNVVGHRPSIGDEENPPTRACDKKDSLLESPRRNTVWNNVASLCLVWVIFVILQVFQSRSRKCSTKYWLIISLQVPVAVSAFLPTAIQLYRTSKKVGTAFSESVAMSPVGFGAFRLGVSAIAGLVAGTIGGLLGVGGGFALGPLLLEFGVHPQVFSVTAIFVMLFSSALSVVEYSLLHMFPVPYALYLSAVSFVGGICGQSVIRRLVNRSGRNSIIILNFTALTLISAVLLGAGGLQENLHKLKAREYMGFSSLC